MRRDLAIQLVEVRRIAALGGSRASRSGRDPPPHLLREEHLLGRVLAETAKAEDRQERVAVGQAHEQAVRSPLQRLVAEVLDERGGDVLAVWTVCDLQI